LWLAPAGIVGQVSLSSAPTHGFLAASPNPWKAACRCRWRDS